MEVNDIFDSFEAFVKVDEWFYVFMRNCNAFSKINANTGIMEYIGEVPKEEKYKNRLYIDLIYANNKIYFVPLAAREIAVYNIQLKEFTKLLIKNNKNFWDSEIYKDDYKFARGLRHGDYVYFFSCTFPAFLKINIYTDEIEYIYNWAEEIEEGIREYNQSYFRSFYLDEDTIYLPVNCSNMVMKFNLKNFKYDIYYVGDKENRYSDIFITDDSVIITSKNNKEAIICDRFFKKEKSINGTQMVESSAIEKINGNICIFPLLENEIVVIGENNVISRRKISDEEKVRIAAVRQFENIVYVMMLGITELILFDANDENIKTMEFFGDETTIELLKNKYMSDELIKKEDSFFGLEDFIERIIAE